MGYHFTSQLTATLNLCLIYFKITQAIVILSGHMYKKFEINRTKIKGGCQSGRKKVSHNSKSDLPLVQKKKASCNQHHRSKSKSTATVRSCPSRTLGRSWVLASALAFGSSCIDSSSVTVEWIYLSSAVTKQIKKIDWFILLCLTHRWQNSQNLSLVI